MSRIPPERVQPLEYDGVRYEGEDISHGNPDLNAGTDHVRAYDVAMGVLLWDKKICEAAVDPDMEEDKLWRFVEKLSIRDGKLIVTDERGKEYKVEPKTGELV